MNNMPYKPIDDFYYAELSDFDHLVLPHVAGVQRPLYELERETVIREFCRRTGALIGQHNGITIYKDVSEYTVTGIPDLMDVLTLKDLRYSESGEPVNRMAYLLDQDRTTFNLQSNWADSLKENVLIPIISLTLCRGADRVEQNFFDRWSDGIAAGIISRLMLSPRKVWSNPQAARETFDPRYDEAISNAKIAVSRAFTVYAPRTVLHGFT